MPLTKTHNVDTNGGTKRTLKTQAITLMKEDVLSLGRMVSSTMGELTKLLAGDSSVQITEIEEQESRINSQCLKIEEKCLDVLNERQDLNAQEIRTLVGSTLVAAKLERLADHAQRVARYTAWALEDGLSMPAELHEMGTTVHRMIEEVLICFLTDDVDRVREIIQRDSHVNYLHDVLSKKLLSRLGEQKAAVAQAQTQFLFCARYLERMGDCCTSIAKRTYFIVTGSRMNNEG